MVQKIKIFKILIFVVIAFIMCFFSLNSKGNFETNLLKTFLSSKVDNSDTIVKVANKSASVIKVVFESDSERHLEALKKDFISAIDKKSFNFENHDISKLLKKYLSSPTNFLSAKTSILLEQDRFDEVYTQSLEALYSPMGFNLTSFENDPFLLFDDYINSLKQISASIENENGKYYDYMTVRLASCDGLNPESANKKVKELIDIQKKLTKNNSKIYLAGNPIHSFYTTKNSIWSINLICALSTLLIFGLTYFYFRSFKNLIPIFLGISFGLLCGYCATRLWFNDFQMVTIVFSTMLIGIGIDYSYHYFFNKNHDCAFVKNLSLSFFTTVLPFVILYFTGIELLRQISVYTIFGLLGIYLFVLIIYPCFSLQKAKKMINFSPKIYKTILCIIVILSFAGFLDLSFNDSLSALYTPTKKLLYAEKLYNKVSGENSQPEQIITVHGDSMEQILEHEELITKKLDAKNIDYISLSKFIPSKKRQRINFNLVQNLYAQKLDKYSDILDQSQIKKLKSKMFVPVEFEFNDNKLFSEFMLNKNTSMIFVYGKNPDLDVPIVSIKEDIEKYMKSYRNAILKFLPIAFALIYLFLSIFYGFKRALKLVIPSYLGCFCATGITSLILGKLNLFSLIALFLVLGFTIDYSVFRQSGDRHSENAIFISCITTAFSFLLLALSGFKLISSITLVLFIGIIVSYLFGYLIYNQTR